MEDWGLVYRSASLCLSAKCRACARRSAAAVTATFKWPPKRTGLQQSTCMLLNLDLDLENEITTIQLDLGLLIKQLNS